MGIKLFLSCFKLKIMAFILFCETYLQNRLFHLSCGKSIISEKIIIKKLIIVPFYMPKKVIELIF